MVVSAREEASRIGVDILKKGGNAFDAMMAASKLPRSTEDEKNRRRTALRAARIRGIETPLGVLKRTLDALECAEVAMQGNPNARSDAGVAVSTARACAEGAWMNVRINLKDMKDVQLKKNYAQKADSTLQQVHDKCNELFRQIQQDLALE